MPETDTPVRSTTLRRALPWLLIGAIALADWQVDDRVPLGWLYLLPVTLLAGRMRRWGVLLVALLCTALAESFDGFVWTLRSGPAREVLYFSAFAGIGLFVQQALAARTAASLHLRELEGEMAARREAEEQLEILIDTTPVAVFTADAAGRILLANNAAERLFAVAPGGMAGREAGEFIPPLLPLRASRENAAPSFRTAMQCRAHRAGGEIFQADVWFSTYGTSTGPRLAAFVLDTSEELRDREESSLDQLLAGSRILVGAVSHEVRNVCAAIQVVYENLARSGQRPQAAGTGLAGGKDFEALGTLVVALERIASVELSQAANQLSFLDLHSFFEELLIILAPALREQEITLQWEIPPVLPPVWADRQSLMQVFLNLAKNSERALEGAPVRLLTLRAAAQPAAAGGEGARVLVHVLDTGPGVERPELLFKPFQHQASATGLGLYLSRALMRSFSGDLRHEPLGGPGACFVVELAACAEPAPQQPHEEAALGAGR